MDNKQKEMFWTKIKNAFKKSGLTQKAFAEVLDIKPPYLSNLLKRKQSGERKVLQISAKLGISVSEMIEDLDPDMLIILKHAKKLKQAERQETIRFLQEKKYQMDEKKELEKYRRLEKEKG